MRDGKRRALRLLEIALLLLALVFATLFVVRIVGDRKQLNYEDAMREQIHQHSNHTGTTQVEPQAGATAD